MDDLSWFHERYLRHGRIFHAHLDLTGRCPLRCRHCYLGAPPGDELTLEELRGVLRQLADLGALSLLLSGGEVFLRQDLQDILAAARGLGFSLLVKTSGALCGEAEVEALASLGVRTVHVSLYSHRGPVHDAVTGVSGSFGRSLGTVRALQDRGVDVQVVVTLLQGYEMDFAAVRDGLRSLGV
ncbi:MAG: radical SAM protein, partial [Deltaproteobacteria bacterium]|nr:radical SAM protein [Deltaproteobacteria bacterium]